MIIIIISFITIVIIAEIRSFYPPKKMSSFFSPECSFANDGRFPMEELNDAMNTRSSINPLAY